MMSMTEFAPSTISWNFVFDLSTSGPLSRPLPVEPLPCGRLVEPESPNALPERPGEPEGEEEPFGTRGGLMRGVMMSSAFRRES